MRQGSLATSDPGHKHEDSDTTHIYEGIVRKGEKRMGEDISFSLKPNIDREKLRGYQTELTNVFSNLIEERMVSQIPATTQIRNNENWLEQITKGYTQIPTLLARTEKHGICMTLNLENGSLSLIVRTYQKDMRTPKNSEIINNVPINYEAIIQAYEAGKEVLEIN